MSNVASATDQPIKKPIERRARGDRREDNMYKNFSADSAVSAFQRERLNDVACWNAVVAHDKSADGLFVYSVKSTGVYCRPSCPSRRPRRQNVAFHQTTDAARGAGFRACLGIHRSRRWPRVLAAARTTCSATSSVWSASRRANTRKRAGSARSSAAFDSRRT